MKEDRLEEVKKFLGDLLYDTLSWSCTDFQHDYLPEFIELLGEENIPKWMKEESEE